MYLTCTNCSTKFIIDENLLVPNGKKVKCSKCGDIWYQRYLPEVDNKPLKDINKAIAPKSIQTQKLMLDQLTQEIKGGKQANFEKKVFDRKSFGKKNPDSSRILKDKNQIPQDIKNEKRIMRPGFATYHLPVIVNKTQTTSSKASLYFMIIGACLYSLLLYVINYQIGMLVSQKPDFNLTLVSNQHNVFEDKLLLKYRITNLTNTDKYIPIINIALLDEQQRQIFTSTINAQHVLLKSQNYIYLMQEFKNVKKSPDIYRITFK